MRFATACFTNITVLFSFIYNSFVNEIVLLILLIFKNEHSSKINYSETVISKGNELIKIINNEFSDLEAVQCFFLLLLMARLIACGRCVLGGQGRGD